VAASLDSLPREVGHLTPVGLDPLLPAALPALCHGDTGVSQVPGRTLARLHSLSLDPGGIAAPSLSRRLDAASAIDTAFGSPNDQSFEARSRSHRARCLRFAVRVTPPHARLATGWWPTFAVRDSHPLGSQQKVSGDCYVIHPPSPGLSWRKSISCPSLTERRGASMRLSGTRASGTGASKDPSDQVHSRSRGETQRGLGRELARRPLYHPMTGGACLMECSRSIVRLVDPRFKRFPSPPTGRRAPSGGPRGTPEAPPR
jgi:hypothetical protein